MTQPARKSAQEAAREREAARVAEEAARLKELYGDLLPDVQVLRARGFVVTREGAGFRVGNKLVDKAGLRAMARREGGLAGMAFTRPGKTVSGLKVGDSVALAPKKPATATPLPTTKEKVIAATVAKAEAAPKPRAPDHSTDLGAKPRVVWLDLGLLTVDMRYQRDIGEGGRQHVGRIVKAFNWNCYQPIIVTENADGTYPVIDGQHRLEAAKAHPLIDQLPCYIIDAPELSKQAQIFVEVNSNRRGLTSSQRFWASHAAGEPSAVALVDICTKAGVTILRHGAGLKEGTPPLSILGPLVAQRLVTRFGARAVKHAISLLAETHPKTFSAFRGSNIGALVRIAADKNFSRDALRRVLTGLDLAALHVEASALAKGGGVSSQTLGTEKLLRAKLAAAAKDAT